MRIISGKYKGTLTIANNNGYEKSLDVELTVFDFDIPERPISDM